MENKVYVYFVSYAHHGGFGNAMITLNQPINRWETLKEIEQYLTEANKMMNGQIAIINYQLLRGPDQAN